MKELILYFGITDIIHLHEQEQRTGVYQQSKYEIFADALYLSLWLEINRLC